MFSKIVMVAAFFLPAVACAAEKSATPAGDTVVLNGSLMSPVSFDHDAHTSHDAECTACHHPSRSEKPSAEEFEKCGACHSQPATAPMKTNWTGAFHNLTATQGVCIDCHRREARDVESPPLQCRQCHKKSAAGGH